MSIHPVKLDIFRTAIPMRSFEHAAAGRDLAEAIVVRLELSDGSIGWGETLPRKYVTGETLETVPNDIEKLYRNHFQSRQMSPLGTNLPESERNNAAACALDLALIDATARSEGKSLGGPIRHDSRVSGVLGSAAPAKTAKRLRLMRLYGLRDFKLKLGFGDETDTENLRIVQKQIGKAVQSCKCTLRVDVNGGWDADQTPDRVAALKKPFGVCVVEQPVFGKPEMLIELAQRCELPLMADESLTTIADADKFIHATGKKVWLNIRISKNGGLDAAGRIIAAAEAGVPFVVGCMVGESGILSAAQRVLLAKNPKPKFVEGNYGKFLLADDLTKPSLRFGYGGKLKPLKGPGLGVKVSERKIARYGTLIKTLHA